MTVVEGTCEFVNLTPVRRGSNMRVMGQLRFDIPNYKLDMRSLLTDAEALREYMVALTKPGIKIACGKADPHRLLSAEFPETMKALPIDLGLCGFMGEIIKSTDKATIWDEATPEQYEKIIVMHRMLEREMLLENIRATNFPRKSPPTFPQLLKQYINTDAGFQTEDVKFLIRCNMRTRALISGNGFDRLFTHKPLFCNPLLRLATYPLVPSMMNVRLIDGRIHFKLNGLGEMGINVLGDFYRYMQEFRKENDIIDYSLVIGVKGNIAGNIDVVNICLVKGVK